MWGERQRERDGGQNRNSNRGVENRNKGYTEGVHSPTLGARDLVLAFMWKKERRRLCPSHIKCGEELRLPQIPYVCRVTATVTRWARDPTSEHGSWQKNLSV